MLVALVSGPVVTARIVAFSYLADGRAWSTSVRAAWCREMGGGASEFDFVVSGYWMACVPLTWLVVVVSPLLARARLRSMLISGGVALGVSVVIHGAWWFFVPSPWG